jgi:hypothetical protein
MIDGEDPQYRRDVPVLTSVIWLFSPVAECWRQDPKRDLWLPPLLSHEAGEWMAMTRAVAAAVATTASSELVSEASRKAMSPSR